MIRKSPTTDKQLHESHRPIGAINSAWYYVAGKNVTTIGPQNLITKVLIAKINLPPLPLLASNKALRESMRPREKSPLFKIAASAINNKYQFLKAELAEALEQEKAKVFVGPNDYPLRIESTEDALPEEKEVV